MLMLWTRLLVAALALAVTVSDYSIDSFYKEHRTDPWAISRIKYLETNSLHDRDYSVIISDCHQSICGSY
jgi:hypothetical protein